MSKQTTNTVELKTKKITRDKERHYMIKESIYQEDKILFC